MADTRPSTRPSLGFLARAHKFAFYATILYVVVVVLLAHPFIQRHVSYQHAITEPWHTTFDVPERYGLAPGKTLNLNLTTSDNVTLGAWFILADPFYQQRRRSHPSPYLSSQPSLSTVEEAINAGPTILYFHGAAGSRSTTWRIQHYIAWSARMQANIFAIDYRGFGDSAGIPSEPGLAIDAYTAWNWLMDHGAGPQDVLIIGHSLGTGVASKLGSQLAREDVKPRGIVLIAPFSSVSALIETYDLFGVPLLQPLQNFALGRKLIKRLAREAYDTLSVIREFNVPTLIAHSTSDMEVPHSHSRTLLDHLLGPLLPPEVPLPLEPGKPISHERFTAFTEAQAKRKEARTALVRKVEVPAFGTMEEFDGVYGRVVYVETSWGAHSKVGLQEGVQDAISSTFRLGGNL
ncbi:alpha/beta-hydrolase [Laetiporus sulphureus 93-53]|uniref:Alpha/beta-hydrolase n=1 Tax=Laetiporus sulphureus 93-53 TaxID=1314785 RepID=A0A165HTA5_9APHY|nr:alpha/beta-hydrolase [Laetiporus sulphureus 93-53]KZT12160.1 alpha/beta-hydrolase [Laetiporus sulphureus 93-53]